MDEAQKNHAVWKKPDKKHYILYDSIYKKLQKIETVVTVSNGCLWMSGKGVTKGGAWGNFLVVTVDNLDCGEGFTGM